MTAVFAWITAHQALMLVLWPALTAAASLAYTQLEKDTRIHAVFNVLASLGIDLPKLWDALGRALTGGGGAAPTAAAPVTPAKAPSKPPTMLARRAITYSLAFAAAFYLLTACGIFSKPANVPPNTPGDVGAAVACVMVDVIAGNPPTDCVALYGEQLVADALQILLHSKNFGEEHPEATAYTRAQWKAAVHR